MELKLSSMEWQTREKAKEEDQLSTDVEDSGSESISHSRANPARARWADLDDSDDEVGGGLLPASWAHRHTMGHRWEDSNEDKARGVSAGYHGGAAASSSSSDFRPLAQAWPESARADKKWEAEGKVPRWQRQWPQAEKGIAKGSAKANGKGITESAGKWSGKGDSKGASKGSYKGDSKGFRSNTGKSGGKGSKCQCQYTIGIEEDRSFRVCGRLLGPQGQHVKDIAEATGAKLRLRGRGSKFLEGPEQAESKDPLMLCVSVPDAHSYEEAKRLVEELLEDVYEQFRSFRASKGLAPPKVCIDLHEGPREGSA
eukprot:TRINITY_DN8033_c0_g1_i1.p1 TRINITY_DN8033_c0_g1~~TRINITY_DN8033_c0_g1_i1.p1  ORF type:complete len:355 (-),score=70.01 TRINITY_DN8033_c0_g1_i1:79-1017(-)